MKSSLAVLKYLDSAMNRAESSNVIPTKKIDLDGTLIDATIRYARSNTTPFMYGKPG
jgi:hypothetical protein